MNKKAINIAVIEYYVSSIVHKEIPSLHSIDLKALRDAWEEVEDEIEDLYFEGRKAAFVQNKMQNTVLRDLTLLYTYSIGVKEGVVQDCTKKELLDDLREQYLYFDNNLFIQGTALKILCNYRRDHSEVEVALLKAIKDLKEIMRFDNVPAARYACDVTGVLTDLLEDPEMAYIAKDILTSSLWEFLTQIVRDISKRRRLPKPAAFDFAKYTHLDNSALRAANEAMVNDTFEEVDVVLESYHKELVMNLQKDCLKTIKVVICKWLNFEHEPELSSKIFDTILSID